MTIKHKSERFSVIKVFITSLKNLIKNIACKTYLPYFLKPSVFSGTEIFNIYKAGEK